MEQTVTVKRLSRDFNINNNKYYKFKIKDDSIDTFCCFIDKIENNKIYPSKKVFCYNKRVLKDINEITNENYILADNITNIDNIKEIDVPFKLYSIFNK